MQSYLLFKIMRFHGNQTFCGVFCLFLECMFSDIVYDSHNCCPCSNGDKMQAFTVTNDCFLCHGTMLAN